MLLALAFMFFYDYSPRSLIDLLLCQCLLADCVPQILIHRIEREPGALDGSATSFSLHYLFPLVFFFFDLSTNGWWREGVGVARTLYEFNQIDLIPPPFFFFSSSCLLPGKGRRYTCRGCPACSVSRRALGQSAGR